MATPDSSGDYAAVARVVRARRTNLHVDRERPVGADVVDELCELATWAPNHKRTWPWHFAHLTGDARARLGAVCADVMAARGEEEARVAKTRGKFLRAPSVLVVGSAPGDSPLRTLENRDTVSAAVQNVLLGSTARGLASYWSSCPKGAESVVADLCGFPADTAVVAIVYLGHPAAAANDVPRPAAGVRHIDN
jgi:nitroreductase